MHLSDEIKYNEGGIYSKVLSQGKHASVTLMCMAAGTAMDEHTSSRAGVLHVLEGEGSFTLEGKDIRMEPGVIIRMGAGAPHALHAASGTAFLLYLYE